MNIYKTLLTILFIVAGTSVLVAQSSTPSATFMDDMTIQLASDQLISTTYEADLGQILFSITDRETANSFLDKYEKPFIKFDVDFENKKAKITLELNRTTSKWSVQEWNEYLKSNE